MAQKQFPERVYVAYAGQDYDGKVVIKTGTVLCATKNGRLEYRAKPEGWERLPLPWWNHFSVSDEGKPYGTVIKGAYTGFVLVPGKLEALRKACIEASNACFHEQIRMAKGILDGLEFSQALESRAK